MMSVETGSQAESLVAATTMGLFTHAQTGIVPPCCDTDRLQDVPTIRTCAESDILTGTRERPVAGKQTLIVLVPEVGANTLPDRYLRLA